MFVYGVCGADRHGWAEDNSFGVGSLLPSWNLGIQLGVSVVLLHAEPSNWPGNTIFKSRSTDLFFITVP